MAEKKGFVAAAAKHHFWILLGLALPVGVAMWWLGKSQLEADYAKEKGSIQGSFSSLNGVSGGEVPLMDGSWTPEVSKRAKRVNEDVYTAWKMVYDRQLDVLKWPERLSSRFHKWIADPSKGNRDDEDFARRHYLNYIDQEVDRLAEVVDAREDPEGMMGGGGYPGGGMPGYSASSGYGASTATGDAEDFDPDLPGTVVWSMQDRAALDAKFGKGVWDANNPPSEAEIRLVQENLWIYDAVFRVIADINKDAGGRYAAPIKTIQQVSIGRDASMMLQMDAIESGFVLVSDVADASNPYANMGDGYGGMMGGGEGAAMSKVEMLTENRYLDPKTFEPLETAPTAEDAHLMKVIPIYLSLVMDQRRIGDFLAACGNAELPIEITGFKFQARGDMFGEEGGMGGGYPGGGGMPGYGGGMGGNPYGGMGGYPGGGMGGGGESSTRSLKPYLRTVGFNRGRMVAQGSEAAYGGMGGGNPYGSMGMGGGYPGGMGGGAMSSYGGMGAGLADDPELGDNDVLVEFTGRVYIYNPPSQEKLDEAAAEEEAAVDADASGEADPTAVDEAEEEAIAEDDLEAA